MYVFPFGGAGGDLLSRVLRRSTIGAEAFHVRVRDGIGCFILAITASPSKRPACALGFVVRYWDWGERFRMSKSDARIAFRNGDCIRTNGYWFCIRGRSFKLDRAIRTGQLHALLRFHTRPIDVVVFHGSQARPNLEAGFPLRCFQRLSVPDIATRLRGWRHDRSTRGQSIPVLSY